MTAETYNKLKKEFILAPCWDRLRFHSEIILCVLGMEGRQLLMKAIIHMFNLDVLYETFPGACYIVMFRPIKNIVASFLSLMRMATAQFRVEHDEKWMNRNIRILRTLVEKGIR